MADVGVSLGIDAQELYQELQNVTAKFVQFSQQVEQAGQKAGAGFGGSAASGVTDFSNQATQAGNSLAGTFGNLGSVFQRGLAALGAGISIKGLLEYGEKIQDLSDRFGVSTQALQRFGNAAEKNGSSLEGVAKGFKALEIARSKALGGGEDSPFTKAFADLGVSIDQLKTLNPEDLMLALGRSSLGAADAVKVLGKDAIALRPTLAGLADGTIDFGNALDSIDIARLKQGEDTFKSLGQSLTILGGTVLSAFVSAWQQGVNSIVSLAQAIGDTFGGVFGGIKIEIAGLGAAFEKLKGGDFKGAAHELLEADRGAAHSVLEGQRNAFERLQQGAETNKEIREGPNAGSGPKRSFALEEGGGEAGETDDQGRAIGGGGKAGKKGAAEFERTKDRVDEKAEAQRLADLSPADRLADLRAKGEALLAESQASYPEAGGGEEQKKLELLESYYDVAKKITEEEKKQTAEKERDDLREKQNAAALDSAKETTKQMQLRSEGDKVGAEQAGIRAKYEKEIAAALDRKNPNEPLAQELRKQEGIALHESNVKEASKSPAEKLAEEKRLREEGQKRNLAEALAKDKEDRENRRLHGAGGLTVGHVEGSGGLTTGSLGDVLSDKDFHKQFQRGGGINDLLSPADDFHKQFQPRGLTRADQVKQGAVGKDADKEKHLPVAEKQLTALEKIEKNTADMGKNK